MRCSAVRHESSTQRPHALAVTPMTPAVPLLRIPKGVHLLEQLQAGKAGCQACAAHGHSKASALRAHACTCHLPAYACTCLRPLAQRQPARRWFGGECTCSDAPCAVLLLLLLPCSARLLLVSRAALA